MAASPDRRPSPKARAMLARGEACAHIGGFYTIDRAEHRLIERLRAKGWLRFWNGRRCRFWQAQFYDITEAGRTVLQRYRPYHEHR